MQKKVDVTWHGKLTEGVRDDLCMALMMAVWWREEFINNKAKYGRWQR
jgi:hypothetical protein